MLENKEGQLVPEVTLHCRKGADWNHVNTKEYFAGRTVIVFSLPGAFTPTCSTFHVPRYNELFETFKKNGVDAIACVSVNDGFVMESWQKDQNAPEIDFLADGNGEFSEGMGMLVDKSAIGFGKRSWRYSMLVKDGKVAKMFIEPDVEGDPYEVSDADTMLKYVAPGAKAPPDVTLITKPGCAHCERARQALKAKGLKYAELSGSPMAIRSVSTTHTTPRVFVDGKLIGGADELIAFLG